MRFVRAWMGRQAWLLGLVAMRRYSGAPRAVVVVEIAPARCPQSPHSSEQRPRQREVLEDATPRSFPETGPYGSAVKAPTTRCTHPTKHERRWPTPAFPGLCVARPVGARGRSTRSCRDCSTGRPRPGGSPRAKHYRGEGAQDPTRGGHGGAVEKPVRGPAQSEEGPGRSPRGVERLRSCASCARAISGLSLIR